MTKSQSSLQFLVLLENFQHKFIVQTGCSNFLFEILQKHSAAPSLHIYPLFGASMQKSLLMPEANLIQMLISLQVL